MPEFPIATGFYEDSVRPIASQQCINWVPQIPQTNAISQAQLKPTPGLVVFSMAGNKICRGQIVMNGIAYTVNGNTFYRINADKTTTSLGVIAGAGRVSMARSSNEICIVVPGAEAYIYSVSGGLVQITDSDFITTLGPSQQVVFKDGYFVHYNNAAPASNQPIFFVSNLNQGLVYDALGFGTAEVDPDKITGLHVNRNILYVGGTITLEPFQNVGGTGFPFLRIQGAVIQKGFGAQFSVVDFDNSFVFVGAGLNEQGAVWKFQGNSATKISTAAIDNIIQKMTDDELSQVFTNVSAEDGGYFAIFHFKDRTFGYDAAATALSGKPMWHERRSKDSNGIPINWRVNSIIDAYGTNIVGDNQGGTIGQLDRDIATEYDVSIRRVVATTPFSNDGNRIKVAEIELYCQSGAAPATGPGSDPYISRQFSDDGGYTFGNLISKSLGAQGDYKRRQIWRKQGQVLNTRVYRYIVDEPIQVAILKQIARPA